MKARTAIFGVCRTCGRRLKRKATVCSEACRRMAAGSRSRRSRNHTEGVIP